MRTFSSCGKLLIIICGLAVPAAFGQNANQWYGWGQCDVSVQGPVTDGNGTIRGQYFHHEIQTWHLTGGAPTGTGPIKTYPATWNVFGNGWDTVGSGETWTLNSGVLSADLQVLQRASDNNWLINAGAHPPSDGAYATITPFRSSPVTKELVFPPVIGGPQATTMEGSNTVIDTAGSYGVYQATHPALISCKWKFAKGMVPPLPLRYLPPISGTQLKPANAPAGSVFVPITPCRVVDTRPKYYTKFPSATGIYPLAPATFQIAGAGNNCGIPALGPTALSLNVTAVPIEPLTSMSIRPIGQGDAPQQLLSATDGLPTANAAIVSFGSGAVEISVTNRSHVLIDVNGYFAPANIAPHGGAFYPVVPCRALNGPLVGTVVQDVDVHGTCKIPTTATAVVMAVTVAPQGFLSFLSAWGKGQPQPATSNINAYDGQKKSNMVIAQIGTNTSVSFFASNATNVVADVVGYFAPPGAAGALTFHPIEACRKVDTTWAAGPDGGPALDMNSTRDFPFGATGVCEIAPGFSVFNNDVPGWARAYSLNFIATPTGALTELNIQPMGSGNVTAWSLYALDGEVTASAGMVAAGTGGLTVTTLSPTHLTMILNGYFD